MMREKGACLYSLWDDALLVVGVGGAVVDDEG
jgi:hypothetical protein